MASSSVDVKANRKLDLQLRGQILDKRQHGLDVGVKRGALDNTIDGRRSEPYAPLSMFKLMLLGQWHGLSDAQPEQALKVRIDFMVFTGFEPGDAFPDATTICRFRNRLVAAKLDQVLLKRINGQLERARRHHRRDHHCQRSQAASAR